MKRIMLSIAAATLCVVAIGTALGNPEVENNNKEGEPVVTHTAVIKTSLGNIVVELYGNDAPKTVANFVGLAEKDFYNGILVHRVVPGFVMQFGDPKTKDEKLRSQWGTGGESIYGGTFSDELNPATPSYQRGYVSGALAMANRGPNTNSSQIFIMFADNQGLPKNYSIFGRVTDGMDIVQNVEKVAVNGQGQPIAPVTILDIDVQIVSQDEG